MTGGFNAPAATECEAERRNLLALHAMELDWGAGRFDYAKIRGILTGQPSEACEHEPRAPGETR